MRTLYHHPLSALSRQVRVVLAEKGLEFDCVLEKHWERRPDLLALNPAGEVPVLVEPDGEVISGGNVICEYLDESYPDVPLIGPTTLERAEVRRLVAWFAEKFAREVTDNLVGEKLMKRLMGQGQPYAQAIRAGAANIHYHLDYIAYLAERRRWLAGDAFSLADIAAAAQISTVDYLGDVPWANHVEAKDWYARIKSRPSFRPLLGDSVAGVPPPPHYSDLDF
ncbi:MAG TPA: glutathione S-transferase family protein [Azospirillaceae bacterium]|nr:glutathione S-transferase family protein [Azospirillaceae bacterium]